MAERKTYPYSLAGPLIWTMTGFVSWCLSTYILSGLMLPVTFSITAALNRITFFSWAVPALKILIPHTPSYLLSFVFCLMLARISRVTIFRVAGFTIAANGVSFYYHMMQLSGYAAHGGDASCRNWILLGMASLLVVSPAFAIAGSLAGRRGAGTGKKLSGTTTHSVDK